MKLINQRHSNKQLGLSLIELLISMVVGLFLLAGVVTNLISTKNADVKRDAVSEMDSNAQYALDTLRKAILHAGYPSISPSLIEKTDSGKPFFTAGDPAVGTISCRNGKARDKSSPNGFRTRDNSDSDILTVISMADNTCLPGVASCEATNINPQATFYTDCLGGGETRDADTVACSTDTARGMSIPKDAVIYSSFSHIKNPDSANDRILSCSGSKTSGGSQTISDNVEAIQFMYGVRDENNNINYDDATQVNVDNNWGKVDSVQVSLLMRSANRFVLDIANTKTTYSLLNQTVTIAAADSRRLFRIYTTTVNLENVNEGPLL